MKLLNPILVEAREQGLLVNGGERVKLRGGLITLMAKQVTVSADLYVAIEESYRKLRPFLRQYR